MSGPSLRHPHEHAHVSACCARNMMRDPSIDRSQGAEYQCPTCGTRFIRSSYDTWLLMASLSKTKIQKLRKARQVNTLFNQALP